MANVPHVIVFLVPEQGKDPVSGAVTIDDATLFTAVFLHQVELL